MSATLTDNLGQYAQEKPAMAMDNVPTSAPAQNRTTTRAPRIVIRGGEKVLEFQQIVNGTQPSFETKDLPADQQIMKPIVVPTFRILLPGADAAQTKLEAIEPGSPEREKAFETFKKSFIEKGHGLPFSMWISRPAALRPPKEGGKASNLYLLVKGMLNEGNPMTSAELTDATARINALEALEPKAQFKGTIRLTESGSNKLAEILFRVADDEMLPSYRPLARQVDPRELTLDNPNVICEETGVVVHGFEVERDGKKEWFSNSEFAEVMKTKIGRVLSNDLYQAAIREQRAAEEATKLAKSPF